MPRRVLPTCSKGLPQNWQTIKGKGSLGIGGFMIVGLEVRRFVFDDIDIVVEEVDDRGLDVGTVRADEQGGAMGVTGRTSRRRDDALVAALENCGAASAAPYRSSLAVMNRTGAFQSGCLLLSAVPKAPARHRHHRRRQLARVLFTVTKAHPDLTSSLAGEPTSSPEPMSRRRRQEPA